MRKVLTGLSVLLLLLAALLAVLLYRQSAPLVHDTPRDLPWTLPDYHAATTRWSVDGDGRIHTQVEHFFLAGISPAMVAWFYQQLPIAEVSYRGKVLPLYHIFHPTEHGRLRVVQAAPNGEPGMAAGAVIEREEWFGPYDSRGRARLAAFSDAGMLAIPEFAGIPIGRVQHTFTAENGGTRYRVDTVIGSQLPVLGPLLNGYLRHYVFHPRMIEQWQRHQVEEVSSLQFFLPALYAQRQQGSPYRLD